MITMVTSKLIIQLILIAGFVFCSSNNSMAQAGLKPNELFFNVGASYMNKLRIDHLGEPLLKSKHTISPIGELGYYRYIYRHFGIKLGMGFTPVSYNINYSINVESETPVAGMRDLNDNDYYIKNFYFLLLLNKKVNLNLKLLLDIDLGIQINSNIDNSLPMRVKAGVYSQEENQSYDLFLLELYYNEDITNIISLRGGCNLQYNFSDKHCLRSGIYFNYYPKDVAIGFYKFSNMQTKSYGDIYLGLNYFGVQVAYGYSF